MCGKAPPRAALQLMCWAASKGRVPLLHRLLSLYPLHSIVSSAAAAACFLLHATASGDVHTVHMALYHCSEAGPHTTPLLSSQPEHFLWDDTITLLRSV